MKICFAPLEGITTKLYRNVHAALFGGVDEYFAPFIAPTMSKTFKSRELADVLPENNKGVSLVPQFLTNSAENFLWAAQRLADMGYTEVNLNLGCPSGTVVTKKKGAGLLGYPDELERLLDEVCEKSPIAVSVKTRLGVENANEFPRIIEIYNAHPLRRVIVHPRFMTDYYRGEPRMDEFSLAMNQLKHPVCYNGNLFTPGDIARFGEKFPHVEEIMIGRGLIVNPALALGRAPAKKTLLAFHERLTLEYVEIMAEERNALFKMKELWSYLIFMFPQANSQAKRLKKTERLREFDLTAREVIERFEPTCEFAFQSKGATL